MYRFILFYYNNIIYTNNIMVLTGYLSGTRRARNSPSLTRHNQCGGEKKQGLAPSSGFFREGMRSKNIFRCNGRLANRLCFTKCSDMPITKHPMLGGIGRKTKFKYR